MWKINDNINWTCLSKKFSWIQDMEGVPQDEIFHAEGDVATHTKMVLAELLALDSYQELSEQEQAILVAAALLHDVEKRSTTVLEDNGRITSKGHAKRGAFTARSILYLDHACPFAMKESISKLVQYHGLPLWFFDKKNPEKAVIQASLEVDTRLLAILAEADVRGRICPDKLEMLHRVDWFRSFCEEQGCFGKPRNFGSNFGRFLYFQKEQVALDYIPYDAKNFEVILLAGLPGTGKDTFIKKQYSHIPMVSIDALRRQHKVAPTDKKKNGRMVQLAKEQARVHLRKRQTFIWNATNITRMLRQQLIDLFQAYGAKTKLIYLEIPAKQLFRQNNNREYPVPTKVLNKMIQKLDTPAIWEAPEVEYVIS